MPEMQRYQDPGAMYTDELGYTLHDIANTVHGMLQCIPQAMEVRRSRSDYPRPLLDSWNQLYSTASYFLQQAMIIQNIHRGTIYPPPGIPSYPTHMNPQ